MPVPETAVDKDHFMTSAKHEVRTARKIASMQAIAELLSVNDAANQQLRFRVH
jgi:hypothetical protein